MERIVKFDKFITNEKTIKINKDGIPELQELELYKDFHPNKFKLLNVSDKKNTQLFNTDFVWVIKKGDVIISTFSADIDEKNIKTFFESLKNNK